MKKYTLLLLILLTSCSLWKVKNNTKNSLKQTRTFASESQLDVHEVISELQRAVNTPIANSSICSQEAHKYYKFLFGLKGEDIGLNKLNNESIDNIISKLFEIRLALKQKLNALNVELMKDQKCLSQVRNLYRALRYFEDYMISFRDNDDKELETFEGSEPFLLRGTNFQEFNGVDDLKSGDVLLSRGTGYTSAAIARVGIDDSQFSHISMVYKNKKNDKIYTIEAHIEIGAVVAPIQKHIDQKNARTVVFRMNDAKLAHRAAKFIYDRVKKESESGKNIPYDFGMNYHDPSSLFCSEVVYEGYLVASKGIVRIPKFKTRFNLGLSPFLKVLGINVSKKNVYHFDTFGPGDIEFDHRFELVAEWRNPLKLEDSRIKDTILSAIFQWMNDYDYRIRSSGKYTSIAYGAWLARRIPLVQKLIRERMPLNMSAKQLKIIIVLEDKIGKVLKEIILSEQRKRKQPLTFKEMYQILEKARLKDLENYKITHKRPSLSRKYPVLFHKFLRPPNKKIFK